jgi:flagellar biosynthesis GTPase FlhF
MSTPGELLEALGREARARFSGAGADGVRVYRGRSVEELVPQIQRELGADAIIVRRREGLTGGVLGFFQHQYVEIEAMPGSPGVDVYDEEIEQMPPAPAAPEPVQPPLAGASSPEGEPAPRAVPSRPVAPSAPPLQVSSTLQAPPSLQTPPPAPRYAPPAPRYAPPAPPAPAPLAPAADSGSAYVTAHLAALARAGRATSAPAPRERTSALPPRPFPPERAPEPAPWEVELPAAWSADAREAGVREAASQPFAAALARPAQAPARPAQPRAAPEERRVVAPGSHARARAGVTRSLKRCGIGEELAQELIDGAAAHALALAPRAGLAQAVRITLAQRIPVAPPLPTKGAAIVIVGAGGTGKTTCCAALLGAYRRGSTLPASCATVTRGGERAELMMILSPTVLKPAPARTPRVLRALRKAQSEGVAIVDTPSVTPADRAGIRDLARLLSELEPERVVVTLPATLGATAAAQLLQALRPLGANSLAVTHADETDQLGVAVEAACRFGLAPEYMLERASGGGWRLRHVDPVALAEKLLP